MIGILVASHGRLAEELIATARQIVGDLPHTAACSIEAGMAPDEIRARLREAHRAADDGQGVLVLVDVLGGTPCNQSLLLCSRGTVEVISGVNLPILIKANLLRTRADYELGELASELALFGQRSIVCVSETLRTQRASQ